MNNRKKIKNKIKIELFILKSTKLINLYQDQAGKEREDKITKIRIESGDIIKISTNIKRIIRYYYCQKL